MIHSMETCDGKFVGKNGKEYCTTMLGGLPAMQGRGLPGGRAAPQRRPLPELRMLPAGRVAGLKPTRYRVLYVPDKRPSSIN